MIEWFSLYDLKGLHLLGSEVLALPLTLNTQQNHQFRLTSCLYR